MSKMFMIAVLVAGLGMALPVASSADSEHTEKAQSSSEGHEGHGGAAPAPASLAGAWSALTAARDAIADDVENKALERIHAKTGPLPKLAEALLALSGELEAERRTRVEGAVRQMARVADALHVAADRGDPERTREQLSRLDGLLELIRVQYPEGALDAALHPHEGHPAGVGHGDGNHSHGEASAAVVDAAPKATVRIWARDPFRFEPERIEVQAGVPTRIELENRGAVEHSLVVRTPDGEHDWVHLHVSPGATQAATYRLDSVGTYAVLCTIPGHTEAGMVGELVVVPAGGDSSHSHR